MLPCPVILLREASWEIRPSLHQLRGPQSNHAALAVALASCHEMGPAGLCGGPRPPASWAQSLVLVLHASGLTG